MPAVGGGDLGNAVFEVAVALCLKRAPTARVAVGYVWSGNLQGAAELMGIGQQFHLADQAVLDVFIDSFLLKEAPARDLEHRQDVVLCLAHVVDLLHRCEGIDHALLVVDAVHTLADRRDGVICHVGEVDLHGLLLAADDLGHVLGGGGR